MGTFLLKVEHMQTQPQRQRRRRDITVLTLTMCLALGVFVLVQIPSFLPGSAERSPLVGHPAPDFAISLWNSSSRQQVHLAALRGKPIVVNFWASWCDPCRTEAPILETAWQHYQSRGVVFIGIAFEENEKDGTAFLQQYHVTYLNGPDTTGNISNVYRVTNVGVPETVFIDRQGVVVSKYQGAMDASSLDRAIQAVLR